MQPKNNSASSTADREIVITRLLNAPRELVFAVWTNPKHADQWWGPNGFRNTTSFMDARPGGSWRYVMHAPDGTDFDNQIDYLEVVKPERLVYNHGSGQKNDPHQFHVTVTFEPEGNKTKLTMRSLFPTAAARDHVVKEFHAIEGGNQTLDRLEAHLPKAAAEKSAAAGGSAGDFVLTRVFDAPRDLVWRAWTDADRLKEWFGPKGCPISSCSLDLRPGGTFHYCMKTPDGHEMWGKWVFREIVRPEKLVVIVSFSDAKGGITRAPMNAAWPLETLSTMTLTENAGKTTLTLRWTAHNATEAERQLFDSSHDNMRQGWGGTMDQLEAYLAKA